MTEGSAKSFGAFAAVAVVRILVAVAFTRPCEAVGTGRCGREEERLTHTKYMI